MPARPLALGCALAAAFAAALVAPGCGKSKAEKALEEERAACLGFAPAGTTLRGATEYFTDRPYLLRCLPGEDSGATGTRLRKLPNDTCDHTATSICEFGWCYYPNDPALCGSNGCWFGCGVRVMPKDDNGDGQVDDDAVICASQWADEQPVPPFCPF
jgi:hypothetical protein